MKSMRNPKRRSTHPGETLREDVLPALEMTQGEFAKRLGVSRLTVSELLHDAGRGRSLGAGAGSETVSAHRAHCRVSERTGPPGTRGVAERERRQLRASG